VSGGSVRYSLLVLLLALSCAGPAEPLQPGTSQAWGRLRLVPHEGLDRGGAGSAAYGDRRLRDVELVDYTRPGFAVVYVTQGVVPADGLEIAIRESRLGTRVEPRLGVVGAAGDVVVTNECPAAHVISYPAAGRVLSLDPGARATVRVPRAGPQEIFILDVGASTTIFAAPGPYDVVSESGRFSLTGLAPGVHELHAWHPRFPPVARSVELIPDTRVQVDLEMGVGRGTGRDHAH
jgi:hypothetical protein